jgi:hypothetical protein
MAAASREEAAGGGDVAKASPRPSGTLRCVVVVMYDRLIPSKEIGTFSWNRVCV